MNSFHLDFLAQAPSQPNIFMSLMPFVLLMFGFYFLMIRPQQKKQKEHAAMVQALKPGDEVITSGGICGTVTQVRQDKVQVKVDDNTRMYFVKSSIQTLDNKDK